MQAFVQMSLGEVHELTKAALSAQGFSEVHAEAIADTITAAERDECRHDGLFRLPFYVNGLLSGQASGDAEPSIIKLTPGIVKVDARYGFSPLALKRGEQPLADRASRHGIAALVVINAFNVAALWPDVERLAERGFVGFAFVAASPYVAPAGGTKPLFGTNPMAFAWPRYNKPPVVFDQASSVSARGEIQLRLHDGKTLPEGWAIGPDGKPTIDPAQALAGTQLPFGGVKGSNIAMMIELLAGPLVGDMLSFEAGERDKSNTGAPCGGELVIAIDPVRCVENGDRIAQLKHAEMLFLRMLEQGKARLPSDRRYEARARTVKEGVKISASLYQTIQVYIAGRRTAPRNGDEEDRLTPET